MVATIDACNAHFYWNSTHARVDMKQIKLSLNFGIIRILFFMFHGKSDGFSVVATDLKNKNQNEMCPSFV